jgi:hypothetical protein
MFRRRSTGTRGGLPRDIVDKMVAFGQNDFDHRHEPHPTLDAWNDVLRPLLPIATSDTPKFLALLAAEVLPAGGWAAFGGERLVKELLSGGLDDPSYLRMMDTALDFLRSLGVPASHLNGYEWTRWQTTRGATEGWLAGKRPPIRGTAAITPLQPNETRLLAQAEAGANSNLFYAQRRDVGVALVIDSPYSDDDPTRSRRDWKNVTDLHDALTELGVALEVPPFWHHTELLPFIPLERPRVDWVWPSPA